MYRQNRVLQCPQIRSTASITTQFIYSDWSLVQRPRINLILLIDGVTSFRMHHSLSDTGGRTPATKHGTVVTKELFYLRTFGCMHSSELTPKVVLSYNKWQNEYECWVERDTIGSIWVTAVLRHCLVLLLEERRKTKKTLVSKTTHRAEIYTATYITWITAVNKFYQKL